MYHTYYVLFVVVRWLVLVACSIVRILIIFATTVLCHLIVPFSLTLPPPPPSRPSRRRKKNTTLGTHNNDGDCRTGRPTTFEPSSSPGDRPIDFSNVTDEKVTNMSLDHRRRSDAFDATRFLLSF